jgi:hypothetical protein
LKNMPAAVEKFIILEFTSLNCGDKPVEQAELHLRVRGIHGKTQRSWGRPWIRCAEVRIEAWMPDKDLETKARLGNRAAAE